MENSRGCDVCIIDVHRSSFAKHLRSEKHLENIRRDEMIILSWTGFLRNLITCQKEYITLKV